MTLTETGWDAYKVPCGLLKNETLNLELKTKNSGFIPAAVMVGGGQGISIFTSAGAHSHAWVVTATGHR